MHQLDLRRIFISLAWLTAILLISVSCSYNSSGPLAYDSGRNDLVLTGSQFNQYNLFRFDTTDSDRTLTLPNASDIATALSASADNFTALVIVADGANKVKIQGGTNVTVKTSASQIKANTSQTVFCVLNNVNSGSQSVTFY